MNDRGRQRRFFGGAGVRVGFQKSFPIVGADFEFVIHPLQDLRDEDLPNTRDPHPAHGMESSIPTVEIADHADALGPWGPNREGNPFDVLMPDEVGSHLLVKLLMTPLT